MNIKKEFFLQITNFGGLLFYLFIIMYLGGLEYYSEFLILILGLIFSYCLVSLIRIFYYVDRPLKQKYSNLLEKIDASSFPSLHSTRIVIISLVLGYLVKNIIFIVFLIVMSVLVMYSRIYLKKHRFVDLIAGVFLGAIIYYFSLYLVNLMVL